jgi:hypothetical protein
MSKQIKCTFTSVWDDGSIITTPCLYDPNDGEVSPETCNADPRGNLKREFITLPDGDEKEVCMECHGYVMKVTMDEGIGKQLSEESHCSDPDCSSNEE